MQRLCRVRKKKVFAEENIPISFLWTFNISAAPDMTDCADVYKPGIHNKV